MSSAAQTQAKHGGGGGGGETPSIRSTNFPIPSGAVILSPGASISRALSSVPSGGTIVLRGGTYGGALGSLRRRVTIQAYPHEAPWIRGNHSGSALTIGSGGSGSLIRGVGFEYWGSKSANSEAIQVSGSNVTFDSVTIAYSSQRGLGIYGSNMAVVNSQIIDSGASNVNAHGANGLDFEHNEIAYSNMLHKSINPSPTAQIGGVKITNTSNTVFRGNDFHNNDSNGLWFDQLSVDQLVLSNRILLNAGHGLAIEVSGHSIVAENVIASNGRDGLKLSGANDVAVYNNTIVGNGWAQIGVYEDPRHTKGPATSDTSNVSLGNNVFMASSNAQKYVLYSFDLNHPAHTTTLKMLTYDDHNVYGRTNVAKPKSLIEAQASSAGRTAYGNLAAFQKATHRELSSKSSDGFSFNAMFVDPGQYNFVIQHGAPAPAPTTLPSAVASALGTSHPSHVGA